MKRMTDDVKWIVYGGQKQIKRLPWLDLEKIRINAVTEDVELSELDIHVQVESEAVEVRVESNIPLSRKGRRKRKGRKKPRLPSVVSREVQTEAPMEAEEEAVEAEAPPPATPDLSALPLPELPKTPNCAWVHPGCKVELRGVPIHEVMRTKTTLQCWCGQKPMIEITTQTCLLPEEQSSKLGPAQGQGRRVRKLPDLNDGRRQGDGGGGGGSGRRERPEEGEWVAGRVRLPPITPANTPLSSADETLCALSRTSLLSLCRQASPLGSACSSVKCAGRPRRLATAHSRSYDTPLSAASSIPLTPLLPLDSLPDRHALPGSPWPLPLPRTPSF